MNSDNEFIFTLFLCGIVAATIVFAIAFSPLLIGAGLAGYGVFWYFTNPAKRERVAQARTHDMYKAVKGQLTTERPSYNLDHYPQSLRIQLESIIDDLLDTDTISTEVPPPPAVANSIEGARYRDHLAKLSENKTNPNKLREAISIVLESIEEVAEQAPRIESDTMADISYCLFDPHRTVERVILAFYTDSDFNLFASLRRTLDRNMERQRNVFPTDYKKDDVVDAYLRGTPLTKLFELKVPFGIPEELRYEHTHIVAATGHGKTQTIEYDLANDLKELGQKSIVVIDSQNELIDNLLRLDIPKEKIVLVNPEDIDFPVALNFFAQHRLGQYSDLEREQLRNSIVELYEFVLSSIMDTSLTGQQSVIFRYVIRLMLEVPNATLNTFLDVLEGGDYTEYTDKLDGVARSFFQNQFDDPEFKRMRKAVIRRLYLILENRSFERMFNNPESKLDMFAEMNAGKLILINTAKATLKETGTRTFGRFFIALIAQASAERALIPRSERTPTIVYVDEAHEYIDRNVNIILSQARKQRIGMFLAHQYLGQLSTELRTGLEANTSIKMAGGLSQSDQRAMGMADIGELPKLTFATYARGYTKRPIPVTFPVGALNRCPKRTDMAELIDYQRQQYAVQTPKHKEPPQKSAPPPDDDFSMEQDEW